MESVVENGKPIIFIILFSENGKFCQLLLFLFFVYKGHKSIMRKLYLLTLVIIGFDSHAQIQATFNYARFFDSTGAPYIETYLEFVSTSLR